VKIVFLARSLEVGGAEVQIVAMAKGLAARGHRVGIVTFYPGGDLESEIGNSDIELISVNKSSRWDLAIFTQRLASVLRQMKPSIIHSFLGPPNILAAVLSPVLGDTKIVWGIRASDMDLDAYDWTWRVVARAEKAMSFVPSLIISNSYAGKNFAVSKGFPGDSIAVVSNGIDVARYSPSRSPDNRFDLRWRRNSSEILIGFAARLDPMKDHPNFLEAAAILKATGANVRFICVGDGPNEYKDRLMALTGHLGLTGDVVWAGYESDMPEVYGAFDLYCQSSAFGEGFPNAVGEAMATGVPCTVTDVGDAARIVGDAGYVVAKRDPHALSAAWGRWLALDSTQRKELGICARRRIQQNFSVDAMLDNSETIYRELLES